MSSQGVKAPDSLVLHVASLIAALRLTREDDDAYCFFHRRFSTTKEHDDKPHCWCHPIIVRWDDHRSSPEIAADLYSASLLG